MNTFNFTSTNDFIGMGYETFLINVTPAIAEEMLSASIGNRKLDSSNVTALVRDITADDYHYNVPGSGIAFDKAGRLVNGHHTLTAFLRSGKPVLTMTLTTGAAHLDKCDTGKSRTLGDSAVMSGNSECKNIAKLGVNILKLINNHPLSNTGAKKEFANSEIFKFVKNNFDELTKISDTLSNFKKANKKDTIKKYAKFEPSVIGSVMWELIYNENYNVEVVNEFALGIMTYNTHPNEIIDRFRKTVIKDSVKTNKTGAWSFETFRSEFKTNFYKYEKKLSRRAA